MEEDVIIADIQQENKSAEKTMTMNTYGKEPIPTVNLISPAPSGVIDPEEIDQDCGTDCTALTEALMIQQKMTKLLIQELKNDQDKVVERVLESIKKVDDEKIKNLTKKAENHQQQIEKLTRRMDKYTGKIY